MAIIGENSVRERTKREAIDETLLKASNLARENDQTVLRLRACLLGAPSEDQTPERPVRPGWLGEMADALAMMIENLEDTAKVLEEISRQVAPLTPTHVAPGR